MKVKPNTYYKTTQFGILHYITSYNAYYLDSCNQWRKSGYSLLDFQEAIDQDYLVEVPYMNTLLYQTLHNPILPQD